MRKIDIVHIYAGTAGSAGLYLDEIIKALDNNYKQFAFANYYYPFNNAKKIFYKYSEIGRTKIKSNYCRLMIRFIELFFSLFRIFFFLLINRPKIVNYSLTSDQIIELIFLKIAKRILKIKLIITCHDVIPFQKKNNDLRNQIERKKKYFKLGDYLLIHNNNSREDLMEFYNIKENILCVPFPLMDMKKMPFFKNGNGKDILNEEKFTVLMFGHFRQEKGLDILVDAWNLFSDEINDENIQIIIAGNFPYNYETIINKLNIKNSIVIEKFVDDEKLISLIRTSTVIVLPYTRGTNSGIPSSVYSLESLIICSDIPMFKNNSLILDKYLFSNGDIFSLSRKIKDIYSLSNEERSKLVVENNMIFNDYRNKFYYIINKTFNKILIN